MKKSAKDEHLKVVKPDPKDFGLNENILFYSPTENNLYVAKSDISRQIEKAEKLIKKINKKNIDVVLEVVGVIIYLIPTLFLTTLIGAVVATFPSTVLSFMGFKGKEVYFVCVLICTLIFLIYIHKDETFKRVNPQKELDDVLQKVEGKNHEEKLKKLKSTLLSIDRAIAYTKAVNLYERQKAETGEDWWKALSSYELEEAVASLFNRKGFQASVTKKSGDGGVDVIVRSSDKTLLIQCKGWESKVGVKPIREMAGVVQHHTEKDCVGIILSTNGFTSEAIKFANQSKTLLWDSKTLSEIAKGQYEV